MLVLLRRERLSLLLALGGLAAAINLLRLLGGAGEGCYEVWDLATGRDVCVLVSNGNGYVAVQE